jgi:hypothetical protein
MNVPQNKTKLKSNNVGTGEREKLRRTFISLHFNFNRLSYQSAIKNANKRSDKNLLCFRDDKFTTEHFFCGAQTATVQRAILRLSVMKIASIVRWSKFTR